MKRRQNRERPASRQQNRSRRGISLLLCAVMALAAVVFVPPVEVSAGFEGGIVTASADAALNKLRMYKWHRVHTQADLPAPASTKYPLLLIYEDYVHSLGTSAGKYYLYGNDDGRDLEWNDEDAIQCKALPKANGYYPNPVDPDPINDIFYSLERLTNLSMRIVDSVDGKNNDARKAQIWFGNALISGEDDWDWHDGADSHSADYWTIYTYELPKSSLKGSKNYPITIFRETSWYDDTGFRRSWDYMYGDREDHEDYEHFDMYLGEEIEVSAITSDYTLYSGMVMNIGNGVILADGVTLTVMPGAVLSVEGTFYNNGIIKNYGTVLVQPDSCITSFLPTDSRAGQILNSGELIDTRRDAKESITVKEEERDTYTNIIAEQTAYLEANAPILEDRKEELRKLLTAVDAKSGKTLQERIDQLEEEIDDYGEMIEAAEEAGDTETAEQLRVNALEPRAEERSLLKAPVDQLERGISTLAFGVAEAQALVENANARIARLDTQLEELKKISESRESVKVRGEGNLVVMKNAKLFLNDLPNSTLKIVEGGSCICNGYIVTANPVTLTNGKLQVSADAAVMIGYYPTENQSNISSFTFDHLNTASVSFAGMASKTISHSIYAAGDYIIEVNGALRYPGAAAVFDDTKEETVAITVGSGDWSREGAPSYEVTGDGTVIMNDAHGNVSKRYADGTVSYFRASSGATVTVSPDGTSVTKRFDGTSRKVLPEGHGYIEYFANGKIKEMDVHGDNYTTVYDPTYKAQVTTYIDPTKEDGVKTEYLFEDGYRRVCYIDGRMVQYDSYGRTYYDRREIGSSAYGGKIYDLGMYQEHTDAEGDLIEVVFFGAPNPGSRVFYAPGYRKAPADRELGELIWRATVKDKTVTECRCGEAGTASCVIVLNDGSTVSIGERMGDASFFLSTSSLWETTGANYYRDTYPAEIPKPETVKTEEDGYTVDYTDGTTRTFAPVRNDLTGETTLELTLTKYAYGAAFRYFDGYYNEDSTIASGEIVAEIRTSWGLTSLFHRVRAPESSGITELQWCIFDAEGRVIVGTKNDVMCREHLERLLQYGYIGTPRNAVRSGYYDPATNSWSSGFLFGYEIPLTEKTETVSKTEEGPFYTHYYETPIITAKGYTERTSRDAAGSYEANVRASGYPEFKGDSYSIFFTADCPDLGITSHEVEEAFLAHQTTAAPAGYFLYLQSTSYFVMDETALLKDYNGKTFDKQLDPWFAAIQDLPVGTVLWEIRRNTTAEPGYEIVFRCYVVDEPADGTKLPTGRKRVQIDGNDWSYQADGNGYTTSTVDMCAVPNPYNLYATTAYRGFKFNWSAPVYCSLFAYSDFYLEY